MPAARILIADDEPPFLKTTGELLCKAGCECRCVTDAPAALVALKPALELMLGEFDLTCYAAGDRLHRAADSVEGLGGAH